MSLKHRRLSMLDPGPADAPLLAQVQDQHLFECMPAVILQLSLISYWLLCSW